MGSIRKERLVRYAVAFIIANLDEANADDLGTDCESLEDEYQHLYDELLDKRKA
jgi:hypothetical protein